MIVPAFVVVSQVVDVKRYVYDGNSSQHHLFQHRLMTCCYNSSKRDVKYPECPSGPGSFEIPSQSGPLYASAVILPFSIVKSRIRHHHSVVMWNAIVRRSNCLI